MNKIALITCISLSVSYAQAVNTYIINNTPSEFTFRAFISEGFNREAHQSEITLKPGATGTIIHGAQQCITKIDVYSGGQLYASNSITTRCDIDMYIRITNINGEPKRINYSPTGNFKY